MTSPWIAGLVSGIVSAVGPKLRVVERQPSARVLALGQACEARQAIAAAAFREHLTRSERKHRGWNVVVHGGDPKLRLVYAQQIAEAAGGSLHVVDASALVGDYIGETEKNLGALLDLAETENFVLFFDDADALFGKRSDVRDAHDRYANRAASTIPKLILERDDLVVFGTTDPPRDRRAAKRLRDVLLPAEPPPSDAEPVLVLPWAALCRSPK